mgnify:FL=1
MTRRGTNIGPTGLQTLDMRLHAPGAKDYGKRQGELLRSLPREVIDRTLRAIEQRLLKSDLLGAHADIEAAFRDTAEMAADERAINAQKVAWEPLRELQKEADRRYKERMRGAK